MGRKPKSQITMPKPLKRHNTQSLQKFNNECRDKGLTYAQVQIAETMQQISPVNRIPANYRRAGEKGCNG